jgi:hypothetical protein
VFLYGQFAAGGIIDWSHFITCIKAVNLSEAMEQSDGSAVQFV